MFHRLRHWFEEEAPREPAPSQHACNHPGCVESGLYRAPKSRQLVTSPHQQDWLWFCLQHVRKYNASWNYYANMTETEVESDIRSNNTWQRPSWPLGQYAATSNRFNDPTLQDPFDLVGEPPQHKAHMRPLSTLRSQERDALALLNLGYPFTEGQLRDAYRSLVKKHHPDANGGSTDAEEKIKQVNEAYATLKRMMT